MSWNPSLPNTLWGSVFGPPFTPPEEKAFRGSLKHRSSRSVWLEDFGRLGECHGTCFSEPLLKMVNSWGMMDLNSWKLRNVWCLTWDPWDWYMGVNPKIGGVFAPKCMVKIMENPMNKWMIWGGFPPIFGNTHMSISMYIYIYIYIYIYTSWYLPTFGLILGSLYGKFTYILS